eukprot:4797773-Pleurochrysis_carterae.AAC.2
MRRTPPRSLTHTRAPIDHTHRRDDRALSVTHALTRACPSPSGDVARHAMPGRQLTRRLRNAPSLCAERVSLNSTLRPRAPPLSRA